MSMIRTLTLVAMRIVTLSRYDNRDYGYSQSYDDFHDEQDDYDMMDYDF